MPSFILFEVGIFYFLQPQPLCALGVGRKNKSQKILKIANPSPFACAQGDFCGIKKQLLYKEMRQMAVDPRVTARWNNDQVITALEEAAGRGAVIEMVVEHDFVISNPRLQNLIDKNKIKFARLKEGEAIEHHFVINDRADLLYLGKGTGSFVWFRNIFYAKAYLDYFEKIKALVIH